MSANRKTTLGVILGGRSVEHDVSIVTGSQVIRACDPARFDVVPLYISRDGKWFTGDPLLDVKNYKGDVTELMGVREVVLSPSTQHHGLIINPTTGLFSKSEVKRLDTVFPAIHGTHGEDGTLQGLFELADIPYVGCGVLASALANDKVIAKAVLRQAGVPVLDSLSFTRAQWQDTPDTIMQQVMNALPFPLFIKPVTLGSSIGIGRADDEKLLRASIDVAAHFDRRVMVESAATNSVEINCALLGIGGSARASVLEQPISWDKYLTFEEKYMRGGDGMKGAQRQIPAPLTPELTSRVQQIALKAFEAIDGVGTARIDFLVKPATNEIFLNEINTMPGSIAFYLWQDQGMSARDVVTRLVEIAREVYTEKRRNTYDYQTGLVDFASSRGTKGVKGQKY